MKSPNKTGFTIVETMLFLAISGALVVSILVGTGASINIQRYRDSITSLQSTLQQQYSNVSNVSNSRNDSWTCDSGGTSKTEYGLGELIGQTDCVLLGKFIVPNGDGSQILIKDVIGHIPSSGSSTSETDLDALKSYSVQVSSVYIETYDLQWGTNIVASGTDTALPFSVLVLRSPVSGIIRTFIDADSKISDQSISTLVDENHLSESLKMCINSSGLFTGTKSAVIIDAGASSLNAIETLGENSGC